jgi:branched-chain amino acid transport system substrate-binding protein
MKRLYFVLAAIVVASLVLAGCGPAATPATQVPATEKPVVPVLVPTATMAPVATAAPATAAPVATNAPVVTQAPASGVPDICSTDAVGCAIFTPGQTIKIGMGAPMTGDYAAFGTDISQGAKQAVSDTGQFQGFSFELDAEDDGGSGEGGAAVANKFVVDLQIVAIEGHIFSGATQAAIPIYEAAGIPMMSPSATEPTLTSTGSQVFNRNVFTDGKQGKYDAEYLYNTLKITKLAVMHDGAAYSQGIAKVVNDTFLALGGEVVAFQAITTGESDYSAVLADVASKKPGAIFYGGYSAEAVVLVNEKKAAGLEEAIFFSDDGIYGQDFLDRTGANGEGAYATAAPLPPASPAKTAFDAAYLATYGTPAGKLSTYTWNAYDAAAVLIRNIESVAVLSDNGNLYIPRAALIAAVRGTKDYQGISGVISCDPIGECSASNPLLYQVQNGAWVEIH